jgi:hypothetical protein
LGPTRYTFVCELCQKREGRDATLFCDTGKYLLGQYNDSGCATTVCPTGTHPASTSRSSFAASIATSRTSGLAACKTTIATRCWTLCPCRFTDKDTVLVPLVCCDTTSAAWGSVIVVEFFMHGSMSRWTRIAGYLNALARGSTADPTKRFWHSRITGDSETARGAPTPRPTPFNQTNLASIITGTDMYAAITGAPPRPGFPY